MSALLLVVLLGIVPPRPVPSMPVAPLMQPDQGLVLASLQSPATPLYVAYLPLILRQPASSPVPSFVCGLSAEADKMAEILLHSPWQEREHFVCDYRLVFAAQSRADDMAAHDYFAHTGPDGRTPNEVVERFGCKLPWGRGNQVESIAAGYGTPDAALRGLLNSASHRPHLTGSSGFFRAHDRFGVGYARRAGTEYEFYYVVMTATCED